MPEAFKMSAPGKIRNGLEDSPFIILSVERSSYCLEKAL